MRPVLLAGVALLTMAADLRPDPQETPGAVNLAVTQDNIQQTICHRGWSSEARPSEEFTEPIKRRLLTEQYAGMDSDQFELDHRVPIEDGGCPYCLTNLWLQPWRDSLDRRCKPAIMLDAACKDKLENFVHRQICTGKMTLAQGQAIFLDDWIAAFRRYIVPPGKLIDDVPHLHNG